MDRDRLAVIGAPLAMLLIGGGVGWFMRDDGGGTSSTKGTVVGKAIPTGSALEVAAPTRSFPSATNSVVFDRSRVIGLPATQLVDVPHGAAVPLSLDGAGVLVPVDANSLQPAPAPFTGTTPGTTQVTTQVTTPVQQPRRLSQIDPPAKPPTTQAPAETSTTVGGGRPGFADPCTTAKDGCPGAVGRVLAAPSPSIPTLDPPQLSMPFAATGTYAAACGAIEGANVPDAFLEPATRPTVAVVINQPSTIALSGKWSDGAPFDKVTMVTSSEFDQQWQTEWTTDHLQKLLLACFTLPLDDVRAHAGGGRATLQASVLAISATGRADLDGPLALSVPLDGEDAPFADQISVGSLGEQRQPDGTLAATVHVHYAITTDDAIPTSSRLNRRTAKIYGQHAFVENADCSGWANNAQGQDRTAAAGFSIATGQRKIKARTRPITAVDGDVVLDPSLPGGWNGFLCVRLFAADTEGHRLTLALRGAPVRSPRTATYGVGVLLATSGLAPGVKLSAVWTTSNLTPWCGPIDLAAGTPGAACTTYARATPDGIRLVLRATDAGGALGPATIINIPVNTAYCNPDDSFAWISDGCSTGFSEHLKVPLDPKGKKTVNISLEVRRDSGQGSIANNPSHAWQVDATQSFAF